MADKIILQGKRGDDPVFYTVQKEKGDLKLKELDSTTSKSFSSDTNGSEPTIPTVSNDNILEFSNSAEKEIFQNTGLLVKFNDVNNTEALKFRVDNRLLNYATLSNGQISNFFEGTMHPADSSTNWFYEAACLLGLITLRYSGLLSHIGGSGFLSKYLTPNEGTYYSANAKSTSSVLPKILNLQNCIYQIIRLKSYFRRAITNFYYNILDKEDGLEYDVEVVFDEINQNVDFCEKINLFPYNVILNLFDFNFTCPSLAFLSTYTPISIFDNILVSSGAPPNIIDVSDMDNLWSPTSSTRTAGLRTPDDQLNAYGKDFISFVQYEFNYCRELGISSYDYACKHAKSDRETRWMDGDNMPTWLSNIPRSYIGGY